MLISHSVSIASNAGKIEMHKAAMQGIEKRGDEDRARMLRIEGKIDRLLER